MKNKYIVLSISLIAIIIVALIFDELLYEKIARNRFVKHIGNLVWLLSVYFIGFTGWRISKLEWIKQLWNFIYLGFLVVLSLLGIVDFIIGGFVENIKEAIGYTRFFFTSPVPFAILWLFADKIKFERK